MITLNAASDYCLCNVCLHANKNLCFMPEISLSVWLRQYALKTIDAKEIIEDMKINKIETYRSGCNSVTFHDLYDFFSIYSF